MLPHSYCSSVQAASVAPWSEPEIVARYAEMLRQCSRTRNLAQGKNIHSQLRNREFDQTTYLGNLTVQMYGSCGQLQDARQVFDGILNKNLYSWSILIAAHVDNNEFLEALQIFRWMQLEGVKPDEVTILSLLRACSNLKALALGEQIHTAAAPELSTKVWNSLISLYSKCGMTKQAREVFDSMQARDLVSWNSMISAYTQHGKVDKALELYSEMEEHGFKPDRFTFSSVLRACNSCCSDEFNGEQHDLSQQLHEKIIQLGPEMTGPLAASLISMHGRSGRVDQARQLYDSVQATRACTSATFNSMITAYIRNGFTRNALDLFRRMPPQQMNDRTFISVLCACATGGPELLLSGRRIHQRIISSGRELSSPAISTALINMYSKCGSLQDSEQVFDKVMMSSDGVSSRSLIVWSSMVAAYARHGQGHTKGLETFRRMELEGVKPDDATLAVVAAGCLRSALELRRLQQRAIDTGHGGSNRCVVNALITGFGRCGALSEAEAVYRGVAGSNRGVVTFTSMIWAYTRNGQHEEAMKVFRSMKRAGVAPNPVSFAGLFEACGASGDLKRGKAFHKELDAEMVEGNVVVANSIIRMYSRCGDPAAAEKVFEKMEFRNNLTWDLMAQITA